jgi:glycosyltransferase involved in cell wall biosynthesis
LTILVPVFNEEEYLPAVLDRVSRAELPAGLTRQIVVVDDGSTDGSAEIAEAFAARTSGHCVFARHEKNRGKGAAIRTGLEYARGEYLLIQDSDLEYDPSDYPNLLAPLLGGQADVVYGTRFAFAGQRRVLYFWHSLANLWLTTLVNLVSDLNLTDVWTGYKAFRTGLLKSIPIRSEGFGFEPEITIKIAQREARIYETPISYRGRTYEDGKKIGKWDVAAALGVILKSALQSDMYKESGPEILHTLSSAHRFNRWMADTIRPYIGRRVLEIGAGIGNLSRCLAPRRERYLAADLDDEHVARLRSRFVHRPSFAAELCDLMQPRDFDTFENQFDTVVCLNVVEHVEDDRLALQNIYRALQPDGRAIVLVPADMAVFGELDRVLGHYRRYGNRELQEKMTTAGFRIEEVISFNRVTKPGWWWNGRILKRRRFSRLQLGIFDRLVWLWRRLDPYLPWGPTSIIVVGRKPK